MPEDISLDRLPVEFILAGENLLHRVQQVAHQIEQRVSKAIRAHGPPSRPGRSRGGVPGGDGNAAPPGKAARLGKAAPQGAGGLANGQGRGGGLRAGDRVRVAQANGVAGYRAGDTGWVVWLSRGPGGGVSFVHCVMDRTGETRVATFCPAEVEPAD